MANPSSSVKLTCQDLLGLPDDGLRHELIDGEHYVSPAPNFKHQKAAFNLAVEFGSHLRAHPRGIVLCAPFDVLLSDFDLVEPDLLYISYERMKPLLTERRLEGAPDLVVEILSPSTRPLDETIKFHLYERQGVAEYWVIDPSNETVRIYRLVDGHLQLSVELSNHEATSVSCLSTPLLPELQIPLSELFDWGRPL